MSCTKEYHQHLKTGITFAQWEQLKHKGLQRLSADEENPEELLDLRDCDRCPSTLSRSVPLDYQPKKEG